MRKHNENLMVRCIRESLISIIPVLIIGAFALVGKSLPIQAYQNFITTFCGGVVASLLSCVYQTTFGILSVYMVFSLSGNYAKLKFTHGFKMGAQFCALACFLVFVGFGNMDTFGLSALGPNGMFIAIVCGIYATYLYDVVSRRAPFLHKLYNNGLDSHFRGILDAIVPTMVVVWIFAIINYVISDLASVNCVQEFFELILSHIFVADDNSFVVTLMFILVEHIFWFCGVHGANVLNTVKEDVFVAALQSNIDAVAAGQQATEIFTSTFIDSFVLMGGCGATWALIIALIVFGKRRNNKLLSKFAAVTTLFNVNEIMVFGFPIAFNTFFLVPFILIPVVLMIVSYGAMALGLVPLPCYTIEWTTPIFISGYLSTGSVAGVILQAVNLLIAVMIYRPFVIKHDEFMLKNLKERVSNLEDYLKECERDNIDVELLGNSAKYGSTAKILAEDLRMWMSGDGVNVLYQVQADNKGDIIGAEALLKWKHPVYGTMYPPLYVKLAHETGCLMELETSVFKKVMEDYPKLNSWFKGDWHISVNVTGITIQTKTFEEFLTKLAKEYPDKVSNIIIEITEQTAFRVDEEFLNRINRIKKLGYSFAIDDFTMGNTSIKYLQSDIFSLLKLDGNISKDVLRNERSKEIVASIASLTKDMGIDVLAEFVETEEQRKMLCELGCTYYQGYLYGKAVPLNELIKK